MGTVWSGNDGMCTNGRKGALWEEGEHTEVRLSSGKYMSAGHMSDALSQGEFTGRYEQEGR